MRISMWTQEWLCDTRAGGGVALSGKKAIVSTLPNRQVAALRLFESDAAR